MLRLLGLVGLMLGIAHSAYADPYQYLPDQEYDQTKAGIPGESSEVKGTSAFLPDEADASDVWNGQEISGKQVQQLGSGVPVADGEREVQPREHVSGAQGHLGASLPDRDTLIEKEHHVPIQKLSKLSRSNFTLSFAKDKFQYASRNNSFNRIFRESPRRKFPGILRLSGNKFPWQLDWARFGFGVNAGVGYNQAKGVYVDGNLSEVNLLLWTIPIDAAVTAEISLLNWLKFGASAGPSVMGLIQSRSDVGYGDPKKNRRQVGYGTFQEYFVRFNVSRAMRIDPYYMIQKYEMTDFYLTVSYRQQNYAHFKDTDIKITGSALAIGFTYDIF